MRKTFLQNEKKDAQRKRNIFIAMAVLLIGIMVFSSVGYMFSYNSGSSAGSLKEYGQTFAPVQTDKSLTYKTSFNGVSHEFYMLPSQVSFVAITPEAQQVIPLIPNLPAMVIAVNPNSELSQAAFGAASLVLSDLYDQKRQIVPALTEANENITKIPVISCANQSYFEPQNLSGRIPIIQIQEANETTIRVANNCIFIEGSDSQSIIAAAERLRYGMWGLDFSKDPVTGK